MSVKRICVDQARAVFDVEDPSQPWIEGQPWAMQELGPWFPCRLTVAEGTEVSTIPGIRGMATRGYRHVEGGASIIVPTRFSDGSLITDGAVDGEGAFLPFDDGMLLQIQATSSPDEFWRVSTGVQPIRRRVRVIGYRADLRRAREPTVALGVLPPEGTVGPPPLVGVAEDPALADAAARAATMVREPGM